MMISLFRKRLKTLLVLTYFAAWLLQGCSKEEDAKVHLQKGLDYIDKGEYEKARLELKSSSQAEKENAETYYALALLDEKNRHYRAMRENLQKTVELAPSHTEARLKLGKVQLLFNEPAAAIEQADTILQAAKENLDASALKASALMRQKKQDEALDIIEQILKANPSHADGLSLKALAFLEKNDLNQALALIDTAIKADGKNLSLHQFQIQLHAKKKDVESVIGDYQQLIKLYPDNQDFKITLAKVYVQAGKPKEAEDLIRSLVAAEPNNIKPKLILLDFLAASAKDKVVDQFRQFAAQHKDQPRLLLNLANWMIASKYFDEAKEALNRVIELEEDSNVALSAKTLLAKMAFDNKDYDGADKIAGEILDDNANYNDAKILQARLLLVKEKYDEAVELLNKVLFSQPNSAEALLLLGQSYLIKGDQKQADKNFANALTADPGNLYAFSYVYEKALNDKNLAYAKEILQKAVSSHPNNINLLEKLAKLNLAEGKWDAAKAVVDTISSQSSPLANDLANFLQGQIYQGQGDCVKALALYREVLANLPENSDSLSSMAKCYETLNKRSEMTAYLHDLLAKNPGNISAAIMLNDLYIADQNYAQGLALLTDLLKTDPQNPQLYVSLAAIKLAQNDYPGAAEVYQKGLKAQPDNIKLALSLASVYELQKNYDAAVARYEALLEKNPQLDVASNNLASVLTDHYANEDALNRAFQLTEKFKDSNQAYFQDTYAWVLIKQGKLDEGIKLLNQLVIKSPEVAAFRFHLGFANYKLGNNALAISELKQALELSQGKENLLDAKAIQALLDEIVQKSRSY